MRDENDGHLPNALRDGIIDLGMHKDIASNLETVSNISFPSLLTKLLATSVECLYDNIISGDRNKDGLCIRSTLSLQPAYSQEPTIFCERNK